MAQHLCLSCGRSDSDVPLVMLSYSDGSLWICPQCLPALIHHPARLTDKIPGFKVSRGEENQREE